MNEIHIRFNNTSLDFDVGFQYDHNQTKLIFDDYETENNFLKIKEKGKYYCYPLTDNTFTLTATWTQEAKVWACQLMKKENDQLIANSPLFYLRIKPSIPCNDEIPEEVPPNFQTAYDKIVEVTKEIEDKLAKGEFDGKDGITPNIQIGTVTTLEPDEQATVERTGTDESPFFNFGIPRGQDGKNATVDEEMLLKLAIKASAEGNPAIATDTAEWKNQGIEVYGQTTQVQTTGAQLLSKDDLETDISNPVNGIQYTMNNDGSILAIGQVVENFSTINYKNILDRLEDGKTYSYNSDTPYGVLRIGFNDGTPEDYQSKVTVDKSRMISIKPYLQFPRDGSKVDKTLYPMLNEGSTAKPWEPYTGGQPSPSPDFPQEMISKEVSEIKVTGKNLCESIFFNKNSNRYDNVLYCEMDLKKNTTYYFSFIGAKGNILYNNEAIFDEYKRFECTGERQIIAMTVTKDLSKDNRLQYVNSRGWIIFKNVAYNTVIPDFKDVQVSFINAIEYEPYKEQTVQLSSPITLRGIPVDSGGNVTIDGQQYISDIIKEKDGVYGVERQCIYEELAIANMDNDDTYPGWRNVDFVPQIVTPNNQAYVLTQKSNIFLNRFSANTNSNNKILYTTNTILGYTQSEFKAKYPNLIAKFIFKLLEPTFEPLPQQDQEAIRALTTYYPTTVLDTGAWSKLNYVADPKNYIDNLSQTVNQLKADMLKLGGK